MQPRTVSRRTFLRGAAGVAAVAGAGGLVSACGGDAATPAAVPGPTSAPAPKKGGRLRAAVIGGSAETADVREAVRTPMDFVRARVVYDTLVEVGPDGAARGVLLESAEPSADGKTWTLRLKPGVRFSNGRPVTVDDILFSLSTYQIQAPLIADVDLKNAKKQDARTVVLSLARPNGWLDLALSQTMFMFPAGTKDFTKAVGSGPYVIERLQPGKGSILTPNPNFWGDQGPYLDQLELVSITDSQARLNALKAGQIDFAASVPLTAARAEANNKDVTLVSGAKWEWGNLGASMKRTKAPFTDPRVSQAMRYAIDREALVRNVTLGFGELGNDLLGQHLPYYASDLPQREHDPERAKSLLKEAGLSDLTVTLRTSDLEYGLVESGALMAEQAKAAGITIKLDKIPAADFLADPAVFVNAPFQSANRKPRPLPLDVQYFYGSNALLPFTGLAGGKVDGMVDAVRSAVSEDKRRSSLQDLQKYLYEEGGDLIGARMPILSAAAPAVHGVESLGYPAYPSLRAAYRA